MYFRQGKLDDDIDIWQTMIQHRPNHGEALKNLARSRYLLDIALFIYFQCFVEKHFFIRSRKHRSLLQPHTAA